MKKILLLFFAATAFGQPTQPLKNVQISGTNNHILSGATFTADAGSTLVGFPGTGTVTHTLGNLTLNAIVIGNGTNDADVLASLGTSGQVLTSNGGSARPTWQNAAAGGGTVTSIPDGSTNGVVWTVATRTTTPTFTFSLGVITPTSVNGVVISGSSTPTLAVTGTTTVSGANTGDQTTVSGNAGTATALQNARTINGTSFNGTANITVTAAGSTLSDTVTVGKGGTGATTLTAHGVVIGNGTGAVAVTGAGTSGQVLTSNGASADPTFQTISGTGTVTSVAATVPAFLSISGSPVTTTGTLAIDYSGTALPAANGGTGSTFFAVSGPASTAKTFTFPNASSTVLTDNAAVTVAQGGSGRATGTTAYALVATGTTATGAQQTLASGATTEILVGGGASALPVWTTASGTGAPARATSPVFATDITLPNGTAPTTGSVAKMAFDTNAWATSFGAIQIHNGTANTYVVATEASDTPTNGQVPTWNTGGTITWETASGGGSPGGSNTQIQYNNSSAFGGISGATSNGTSVTFGSGNLIATAPKIVTGINDTNGNELFLFTATASAVNEITLANAATGTNPTLTASGGDTNIGITFIPKGTGIVKIFSSTNDAQITLDSTTLVPSFRLQLNSVTKATFGVASGTDSLITGSAAGDTAVRGASNLLFSSDDGSSIAAKIVASTGQVLLPKGITSTTTTSGTLVVTGGVGISENLNAGGKINVGTGVSPDSGGIKHSRITTGSIGAGSTALVTVTWTNAFADANYTVSASVVDSTTSSLSLSVVHIESISASAVAVRVINNAVGSLTGTLHCIAMHD